MTGNDTGFKHQRDWFLSVAWSVTEATSPVRRGRVPSKKNEASTPIHPGIAT